MLVVCDYMCCCWLIYKSTVRGFILLSFAFSIHSFLISLPRSHNGAKAPRKLHLNIYKPAYKRCTLWLVNDQGARDPRKPAMNPAWKVSGPTSIRDSKESLVMEIPLIWSFSEFRFGRFPVGFRRSLTASFLTDHTVSAKCNESEKGS